MDLSPIRELPDRWREAAEQYRNRGLEREARKVESFARNLDQRSEPLREYQWQ